jgi:hypothetical protein
MNLGLNDKYAVYRRSSVFASGIWYLVFGFVGTDHLRTKISVNDETLEQVSQFIF